MPPPSPAPGCASGDVCSDRTARRRTTAVTLPSGRAFPAGTVHARRAEAQQKLDERVALIDRQPRLAPDVVDEVEVPARPGLEDAGPHVKVLDRKAQRLADALQDV